MGETVPEAHNARHSNVRLAVIALTAVLMFTVPAVDAPSVAHADAWMHVSCINPDQSPAPSEGWSGGAMGAVSIGSTNNATCAPGRPMTAYLSTQSAAASGASEYLEYTPPTGSTLIGGSLLVGLSADGYGHRAVATAAMFTPAYQYDATNVFLQCVAVLQACQNGLPNYYGVVNVPAHRGGHLYLGAGCSGQVAGTSCSSGGSHNAWSLVGVSWANMLLASSALPTASDFEGSLLAPSAHGTSHLTFTAADAGGPGIYQATVTIDGAVVYNATPNTNTGKCVPVGTDPASGALMWDWQQPCPKTQRVVVPVDTTVLSDGEHELKVTLQSAAANGSTVLTQTIRTDNRTTISGELTSDAPAPRDPRYAIVLDAPTRALVRGVRRRWARSSLTLSGALQNSAGVPAPGVAVKLLAQNGREGKPIVVASTTSDAAGRWVLRAPRGPSRALMITYGTGAQGAVTLKQTVTPAVTLRVQPLGGGRFRFRGRLRVSPLGSPLPLVVIQVHKGRHWQDVGSAMRVTRSGTFTLTYSGGRDVIGLPYAFRAVAHATRLFGTGISPPRTTVAR